jgi:hypothetical protein
VAEVVASYHYAQRKTRKSINVALTTLTGSTFMNGTLIMGIFFSLLFAYDFKWVYASETIGIVSAKYVLALYALKKVHTVLDAIIIILIYPATLGLVGILHYYGGLSE